MDDHAEQLRPEMKANMTGTAEVEEKIAAYAETFLWSYAAAITTNYGAVARELESLGQRSHLLPVCGRQLGRDTGLVLLSSDFDFYLFFIDEPGVTLKSWQHVGPAEGFDQDWTFRTPDAIRARQAREYLGLSEHEVLKLLNVPGTNFISYSAEDMVKDAEFHASGQANSDGASAEKQLPTLRSKFEDAQIRSEFSKRYKALETWTKSPQTPGSSQEVVL